MLARRRPRTGSRWTSDEILESTLLQIAVTVHAPWASEDSDGEESDCHDHRAPSVKGRPASSRSPMPGTALTEGPDLLQRYVRMQQEHVEASVVVLTKGIDYADTAYSNQSELNKQLALQQHPEPLPGSDEVCPGPASTPVGSLRMMLMMIPTSTVRPEDVDVPRGSVICGECSPPGLLLHNGELAAQQVVDAFVNEYVVALEEHRCTLSERIGNIRQAKMKMIMAQKLDLGTEERDKIDRDL
uniref:Uncharacterized protein n=1 Tax=Anopheles merus TaxID=30066 RepID=A0A182V6Q9_ANOME